MAFHDDHPKLENTTRPSIFVRANKIFNTWSEEHPHVQPKQISQVVALLDPRKLVTRRIRNPFRTSCTNSKLRWLFYYHASKILSVNSRSFPLELNYLLNEVWRGDDLSMTEPKEATLSEYEFVVKESHDSPKWRLLKLGGLSSEINRNGPSLCDYHQKKCDHLWNKYEDCSFGDCYCYS